MVALSVTQSTLVNPTLQLFNGGIYTVRLIVSDGSLASPPMLIEIHTN